MRDESNNYEVYLSYLKLSQGLFKANCLEEIKTIGQ